MSEKIRKVHTIVELSEPEVTAEHINDLEKALTHVDVNMRYAYKRAFDDSTYTFLIAAASRNITCCRILLAHKADVNKDDGDEEEPRAPFDSARRYLNTNMMFFLLEMGASKFECPPPPGRLDSWYAVDVKCFDKVLGAYDRKKITDEVESVLTHDTAGIVSEYVVEKRRALTAGAKI